MQQKALVFYLFFYRALLILPIFFIIFIFARELNSYTLAGAVDQSASWIFKRECVVSPGYLRAPHPPPNFMRGQSRCFDISSSFLKPISTKSIDGSANNLVIYDIMLL